jgi:hypothetical protein
MSFSPENPICPNSQRTDTKCSDVAWLVKRGAPLQGDLTIGKTQKFPLTQTA